MKGLWPVVVVTHATAAGAGCYLAPRESLNEVSSGFFQVDTTKVLSATVESLRAENSLVVWSYRGTATVKVTRGKWWMFKGEQRLIVTYVIDYRLNLADLTLDKVEYPAGMNGFYLIQRPASRSTTSSVPGKLLASLLAYPTFTSTICVTRPLAQ